MLLLLRLLLCRSDLGFVMGADWLRAVCYGPDGAESLRITLLCSFPP